MFVNCNIGVRYQTSAGASSYWGVLSPSLVSFASPGVSSGSSGILRTMHVCVGA